MLQRLNSSLRSFSQRPASDWALLCEAVGVLVWSKFKLHIRPFAQLAEGLGHQQAETLAQVNERHRPITSKVSWAVQTAARYLPLRLVCLPQALAAHAMLSRRGVESTLYLGVKLNQVNALTAHAWLRTGSKYVTGGNARHGQSVVACFAHTGVRPVGFCRRVRIAMAVATACALAIFALMPEPPLHDIMLRGHYREFRHLIHVVGSHDFWFNFAGIALAISLVNIALYGPHRTPWRFRWQVIVLFNGFITLLECLQGAMPHRHFDPMDILASFLATLAVTLFWVRLGR